MPKDKIKILLIIILAFSFLARLYRLNYPNTYVFDEVYHSFTAREYTKGSIVAWEWWTKPPPGVAYEWTHPPLAKEIMALNMIVWQSQNAWIWRLPGIFSGTFNIFLVFGIAILLFKNKKTALISSFVYSIDGLSFVQSRVGMNDTYLVTFILLSLYLFLKNELPRSKSGEVSLRESSSVNHSSPKPADGVFWFKNKLFLSSVSLGLALSSKWTAIYFFPIYIFLLFRKKKIYKFLFFITIPVVIYLLSYLPFFLLGHSFNQFIELQKQMWWYHTHLKAHHNYSSPWWSWPFNLYPVWYFVEYSKGTVANIFASGNFLMFWCGFISIIFSLYDLIRAKSKKIKYTESLMIVLLGYFIFWLPWAFSPRIMFLYHYAPSLPFLSLCLGYQLNKIYNFKQGNLYLSIVLLLIFLNFILLYPMLTGIFLPKNVTSLFFLTNFSKNPF